MLTDHRCTKYTDCSSCSFYQRDIFKYRLYPKGYVIPQTRCMQNMVFFLVKGEIWLNSEEHPDTTFRGGQFVLQPIGSKVECKVLDYTECIIYLFERPQNICDNRFNKGISIVENERQQPIVMTMVPPIQLFIEGMKLYLNDDLRCSGLMQAKRSEMVYLLNCYYPIKELAGPELLDECRTLQGCPTGEAKITKGYRLKARHVIHTVGPIYRNGQHGEPELLENCYRNSLRLAKENRLRTIAFPSISTGVYGYPIEEAAQIAIRTIDTFLKENPEIQQVTMCCFSGYDKSVYTKALEQITTHEP